MPKLLWRSFEKFEKSLFYLLVLFLPVNLAKHFFLPFVYVDGILVDYLIPTIYLTDVLLLLLLFLWLFKSWKSFRYHGTYRGTAGVMVLLVVVSLFSVFNALNQPAAFYKWLKLLEYVLFSFYVAKNVDVKRDWSTIVKLLSVGVLFESSLAIMQWFNQGSIFGFWFFGENVYTVSTPGIALLEFAAVKKVRPYGTFPHPNVLGGYLAVLLPWIFYEGVKGVKGIKGMKMSALTLLLGLFALYFSFSRSAWVVGVLGLVLTLLLSHNSHFPSLKSHLSNLTSPVSLLTSLSYLRRAELNWISLEMVKDNPIFGVGLNNFTVRMGEYGRVSGRTLFLQPVHNIYLLIAAEIGLIGFFVFLGLLFSLFRLLLKTKNYLLLISLAQIVLLGLTDHYLWTIQQTSLLFWLVVGLAVSCCRNTDDV